MSDTPAQEPTMEEILASIRRIISEDDAPADKAEAPLPIPEPMEDLPPLAAAPEDDVLELTERVDAPAETESIGDLDIYTPPGPAPEPEPEPLPVFQAPAPEPEPVFEAPTPAPIFEPTPSEGLIGAAAATAAASHFGKLASGLLMPANGRTLEDVVRELLNPLLKDWLDTNLPAIVEAKVEEEIARVSRGRVG
jgi:cell pole-organizing protein PopZ